MRAKFGYKNVMAVPKIEKVVVNAGIGRALKDNDKKLLERIKSDIAVITGQRPVARPARQSIAGFKIREGMTVGYMATLRGKRMYDFLERLVWIAFPRTHDFRGIPANSVDQSGNLNVGIREQSVFPEVEFESSKDLFGLQVTVVTTAGNKEMGLELFRLLGFPVRKES